MFAHLRDAEANKVDAPRPVDLTPECCSMMEKLMLAQAQVGACMRVEVQGIGMRFSAGGCLGDLEVQVGVGWTSGTCGCAGERAHPACQ